MGKRILVVDDEKLIVKSGLVWNRMDTVWTAHMMGKRH